MKGIPGGKVGRRAAKPADPALSAGLNRDILSAIYAGILWWIVLSPPDTLMSSLSEQNARAANP